MKTIFRTRPSANFTTTRNEPIRDARLSFRARGLWIFVWSHPDNWQVHQGWLEQNGREGREAIRAALRELETLGYAVYQQIREGNRIAGSMWTFFDIPVSPEDRSTAKLRGQAPMNPMGPIRPIGPIALNDGNPASCLPTNQETPHAATPPTDLPASSHPTPNKDYPKEKRSYESPPIESAEGTVHGARGNNPAIENRKSPCFPPSLDTPDLRALWSEWEDHCREADRPLTTAARRAQLAECERAGLDRTRLVIRGSIAKSARGVLYWDFDRALRPVVSSTPRRTNPRQALQRPDTASMNYDHNAFTRPIS
jgi:hypothetical protein